MPLPPYDLGGSAMLPPVVEALKNEAARAAGFVLGSPTYHNSYSGLLKPFAAGPLAKSPPARRQER